MTKPYDESEGKEIDEFDEEGIDEFDEEVIDEPDDEGIDEPETALDVPRSFRYEEDTTEHGASAEMDRDAPFDTLVSELDRTESTSGNLDELFDREEVDDVDSEQLWEQVEEGGVAQVDGTDREIRTIPKSKYCHGCEHFSAPPEVACLHEGSEIIELSTLETFRVANCPVVLKDEELERKY